MKLPRNEKILLVVILVLFVLALWVPDLIIPRAEGDFAAGVGMVMTAL